MVLQVKGRSVPLGATVGDGGVNFSLFSRTATGVELVFFDREDDAKPSRVITLDPIANRTYYYWHVLVPSVRPGQIYAYRVSGPSDPTGGLRFDPAKVLLDPYGREVVVPDGYSREAASRGGDNAATAMKNVVVDPASYDWEGDTPLHLPSSRTIIYELHVRGFTRHPNSGVDQEVRGTYAGLVEKIPYLRALGVTAVELLPVFQFDVQACPPGLVNYWGYQPVSFFAAHRAYSSRQEPLGPANEFRDMVKALHRAGMEVILDVVFNHTAEVGADGPTLGLRGIDNPTYYVLEQGGARYADYTGCGNTLNANNPVVRRMIVDSLRYWVNEMHVDGFRFDPVARFLGAGSAEPAGAVGHRNRPVARRNEADCRGVGCSRVVPGGQLHRGRLEGVERPIPGRLPRLLPGRPRFAGPVRRPAAWQSRSVRAQGPGNRAKHKLCDLS